MIPKKFSPYFNFLYYAHKNTIAGERGLITTALERQIKPYKVMLQDRNSLWGVQIHNFVLKASLIVSFCGQNIKNYYIQCIQVRLGGANAPLHPLWLRYCFRMSNHILSNSVISIKNIFVWFNHFFWYFFFVITKQTRL